MARAKLYKCILNTAYRKQGNLYPLGTELKFTEEKIMEFRKAGIEVTILTDSENAVSDDKEA